VCSSDLVGEGELSEFLERNRNWAASRLARLPETTRIEEGATIPFMGVEHKIVHLDRLRGVVEAKLILDEQCLLVPGEPEMISRKMITFLKKEARKELNIAVSEYAEALNVRPKIVRITDTTSRWGSCSTTRTLSFSWRIIMAPPVVLRYLAAHEVAHLREMNHSPDFWNLVREICPDMDKRTVGDVSLGNGPVVFRGANINPKLESILTSTAKTKRIKYQSQGTPGATPTDANAIQVSRAGVAASLIGVPNRYMHTQVEVVSLSDLETTAKLISETVAKINPRTDFIPQ